jgi:signal transduction histidine kinase
VREAPAWLTAIGQIFHVIPDLATPAQVESSLREILQDADLELLWWSREDGCYVDVHDVPREPVTTDARRSVTFVEYDARKVGAVLHDRRLLDHPEFLASFVPTMRIAMERDRLHRDLRGTIEELRASRLRMVTAGEAERRRLERNLHDGAQQRLIVALLGLRRLEQQVRDEPELADAVRGIRNELESALEELRELARGLHPPLLARRGLEAAVRSLSSRSTLPVELDVRLDGGLAPAIEAAAYYVCSEAVTNAVKHARATRDWVKVVHENGALTVEVRDDGVGGACIDCDSDASGLSGLRDRVEALDGTLDVLSPAGAGTVLQATFPAAAAEAEP